MRIPKKDAQQLALVIEHYLSVTDPELTTPGKIARRIFNNEPELMHRLWRPWAEDRIAKMVDRIIKRQMPPEQKKLPGFEDFPPKIPTQYAPGAPKIWLENATLAELQAYRKVLVKERDARLAKLDQLIAFMKQHTDRKKKLTVREAINQYHFEFAAGAS